jgi:hypothetical protein
MLGSLPFRCGAASNRVAGDPGELTGLSLREQAPLHHGGGKVNALRFADQWVREESCELLFEGHVP